MPVYDYKCTRCAHRFELMRTIARRDEVVCPKCGAAVTRVYEGRWAMGCKSQSGCSGDCSGCPGCQSR